MGKALWIGVGVPTGGGKILCIRGLGPVGMVKGGNARGQTALSRSQVVFQRDIGLNDRDLLACV